MQATPLVVGILLGLAGCTTYDPLYCADQRDCKDPDRPFCDLEGDYPASDGVARTCIPSPFDGGPDDGGDDGSGATSDAGPDGGPAGDATASCNDRLVFVSTRDGNAEVYLSDPDGSNQINLTQNPSDDSAPSWSPDGSRIAFVRDDSGIWTMNADGSEAVQIVAADGDDTLYNPRWSPDGTRIAYVRFAVGSGYRMWAIDSGDAEPEDLARASGPDFAWSPDGTKIAFESPNQGNADIFTMNSDGTEVTNRTNNADIDRDPTWSPDGQNILFTTGPIQNTDVWVMTDDGKQPRNLTNSKELDGSGVFTPDGSKIVFSRGRELFRMNPDGTGQQQITFAGDGDDSNPTFSPDGTRMAWRRITVVKDQFIFEVFVADVDGSGPTRVTPEGGDTPAWRPCP